MKGGWGEEDFHADTVVTHNLLVGREKMMAEERCERGRPPRTEYRSLLPAKGCGGPLQGTNGTRMRQPPGPPCWGPPFCPPLREAADGSTSSSFGDNWQTGRPWNSVLHNIGAPASAFLSCIDASEKIDGRLHAADWRNTSQRTRLLLGPSPPPSSASPNVGPFSKRGELMLFSDRSSLPEALLRFDFSRQCSACGSVPLLCRCKTRGNCSSSIPASKATECKAILGGPAAARIRKEQQLQQQASLLRTTLRCCVGQQLKCLLTNGWWAEGKLQALRVARIPEACIISPGSSGNGDITLRATRAAANAVKNAVFDTAASLGSCARAPKGIAEAA
ncbi:uncharacterized protein LOC113146567 [Cyclospora cayetanensis]|uniref:Uncharacterized protein LOC113146567 n=1 Tax=Cyclospora cayetanensis TaxID=88456 RepID=A0A6P6RRD4_9EIME|nr:uncharacterized protein LOC113146567 [Cyclospora cayetanensis]